MNLKLFFLTFVYKQDQPKKKYLFKHVPNGYNDRAYAERAGNAKNKRQAPCRSGKQRNKQTNTR